VLALTARGYLDALQQYRGALARRNAALREAARSGRQSPSSVVVWEPALAEHGALLWRERRAWVASMEDAFERLCNEIGEPGRVRVSYSSTLSTAEDGVAALADALAAKRPADLARGLTHVGPHRDDLVITLEGRDPPGFGPAGQRATGR